MPVIYIYDNMMQNQSQKYNSYCFGKQKAENHRACAVPVVTVSIGFYAQSHNTSYTYVGIIEVTILLFQSVIVESLIDNFRNESIGDLTGVFFFYQFFLFMSFE